MRRADRLFQIIQILRAGRLTTARALAERLEVSERTIYRDIADLQGSGVPIDGEAGVGYLMREGYDLPPLMFTRDEMAALVVGARIVRAWGGERMAQSAEDALAKINTVLPEEARREAKETPVFVYDPRTFETGRRNLDQLNQAILERSVLSIDYDDLAGESTHRDVEPLGLYYWGKVWTLVAWCRLRDDFRSFRIDRISAIDSSGERYERQEGKTLEDYLARMVRGEGRELPPSLTSRSLT